MFWSKKEEPVVLRKPGKLVTNSQDRIADGLVLQHLIKYIDILSKESQSGFQYCSDKLRETAKSVQDTDLRSSLLLQASMMDHLKDRMEYIDAHKVQQWDDAKYRRFIDQFCPVNDDE